MDDKSQFTLAATVSPMQAVVMTIGGTIIHLSFVADFACQEARACWLSHPIAAGTACPVEPAAWRFTNQVVTPIERAT